MRSEILIFNFQEDFDSIGFKFFLVVNLILFMFSPLLPGLNLSDLGFVCLNHLVNHFHYYECLIYLKWDFIYLFWPTIIIDYS